MKRLFAKHRWAWGAFFFQWGCSSLGGQQNGGCIGSWLMLWVDAVVHFFVLI